MPNLFRKIECEYRIDEESALFLSKKTELNIGSEDFYDFGYILGFKQKLKYASSVSNINKPPRMGLKQVKKRVEIILP